MTKTPPDTQPPPRTKLPSQADALRTDYDRRETLSDRLFGPLESRLEPFVDSDRRVLPTSGLKFILHFALQAKGLLVAMLLVGGMVGAAEAAMYWGLGWLIDTMEAEGPAGFVADNWLMLAALLLLVLVVRAALMIAQTVLEQNVIYPRFLARIRWQSFSRVIEQPYSFYQNDFAGRIAQKIMQAGEATGDLVTSVLQTFWSFFTFIFLTVSILLALDPSMAIVILVWLVGYVATAWFLLPVVRRTSKRRANARSILSGRMVDAFTNILAVKLFDSGSREHGYVKEGIAHLLFAVTHGARAIAAVRGSIAVLNGLMMAGVGIIAVNGWLAGTVTTGAIATAMGLVFRLNQMSGWMMFNINGIVRNFATVQDATNVISVRPAIEDASDAHRLDHAKGELHFENVSFAYDRPRAQAKAAPSGDPASDSAEAAANAGVIRDLTLRIAAGERVGLVGPSGAGKTTLVNLALRLFEVDSGRVLIDGEDIRAVTQASLRHQFGVVSQEPMLMHRSIRDNIAYGRDEASDGQIRAAAEQASAHDFIERTSDSNGRHGYDAHVGERGVKLSGGQRQRIAIARMILKDAPILLLDEATSALDSEIESAIQDNLWKLMQGKTVLAVAHRLSTIAMLDRIVVIDGGRIVEEGDHETLLKKNGLYARLWARQSGGFLPEALAAE